VALSFAGAQRDYVGRVATALKARGVRCFYDADEQVRLWGTHLAEELPRIYAEESAAVVVFISADYAGAAWTRLERRVAFSRAVAEAGVFVLPARFDDSQLPGLLPDVVSVDLRGYTPEQFADLVAAKLADLARSPPGRQPDQAGAPAAGRPLEAVTDPFALEVHRPVQPEDSQPGLPALPEYVPRDHDVELGQVVRAAAQGRSGIAVLVGGSSTGKTRACWEALGLLRDRPDPWRLWHPIDPTRPEATLRELPRIGPRTVVWLNEAQFYLGADALGERVAAGLRELLRDPARAPVLVLATLWPQFWGDLTAGPAGGGDPHAQARELLAGHDITVPNAFTAAQVRQLGQIRDVRLAQAAAAAQDGQVIQFLAGAPELLARYRNAPPAAAAVIAAAMDARRLGAGPGLPGAFLGAAAPGYLTAGEWDALEEDWLEQALAYTAVPCKGVRGPLTRIRPRPAMSGDTGAGRPGGNDQLPSRQASLAGGPLYRLADYLDQHGREHRKDQFPPPGFWAAAAGHALPRDQAALGDAAQARGLYRAAAQLYKNAAASGDLHAVSCLSDTPHYLRPGTGPGLWAVAHVPLDDPAAAAGLLDSLRAAGTDEQVTALLHRDPAAHVSLGDPGAVARLLGSLREAGAADQVTALATRAAVGAPLGDPAAVSSLIDSLHRAAAQDEVTVLAARAAASVPLDVPAAVSSLIDSLRRAAANEQMIALLRRDPAACVSLSQPLAVGWLLGSLRKAGAAEQVTALANRAAHAPLDDPLAVIGLLHSMKAAGTEKHVAVLATRAAGHVPLDDPDAVAGLLDSMPAAGAHEQVTALLQRDPAARAPLRDPRAIARLLGSLRTAGAHEQLATLADRAATHTPLDNPRAIARLLDALRAAGIGEQLATLADRAAAHAPLDNPRAVTWLLDSLRAADAAKPAATLAGRAAAHVSLGDPDAVIRLLASLREAGAQEQQLTDLADRAAALAPLDNPDAVTWLLDSLRAAGAQEQVTTLLQRNPAALVSLDNPRAVAALLDALRVAGAEEQVTILLHRDPAARAALRHPYAVIRLLESLRAADAQDQATKLADRLPGAGLFELFRAQGDRQHQFRYGREADGSPARPWSWEELD
jgi:hypothetical protein